MPGAHQDGLLAPLLAPVLPVFTAFRNALSALWGLPRSETGPVFTAFRNATRWVAVCCGV